ncbi:MAG: 2-phosphosulfolactate phosphatase [Candidatus Cyclobacteriaceae bacterium M2_1C_046]
MRKIDVCLSPQLLGLYDLEGRIVVVVDILRATSCMVSAFGHGIRSIIPFADADACLQMRRSGYIVAGERNGKKIEGFDLGNSPLHYVEDEFTGEKLAMTTTNGTVAINSSREAKELLIGAFLNLSALTEYLKTKTEDILILCAGWKGKVNLEDTLFAGALVNNLKNECECECDAPQLAETVWLSAKHDPMGYLRSSSHVQRLKNLDIEEDIEFCLTLNAYNLIPFLDGDQLVAKYF